LLATNLWLLWVIQNQRGVEAVLLLLMLFLMLAFFAWVYGSLAARAHALLLLLVLLLAGGATIAVARMIQRVSPVDAGVHSPTLNGLSWTPFTPQALASLRAEGKPVLVDFTASWCLTCQFNERTAIDVPAVRQLLQQKGIVAMKGDWTNSDPAITEVLKSFGRVGVPLVVFYPEGKESAPIVLPELLTERIVLEALKN